MTFRDILPPVVTNWAESFQNRVRTIQYLQQKVDWLEEGYANLEMAAEEQGWRRLVDNRQNEFTREFITDLICEARAFAIKNPMVLRAVETQALYVWALGVSFECDDKNIEELINEFVTTPVNAPILGTHEAWFQLEKDQRVDGNLFFVFYPDAVTGDVAVRMFPPEQIVEIVTNPDDGLDPWFYKRVYSPDPGSTVTEYHPCYQYLLRNRAPSMSSTDSVVWDQPIYHTKTGGTRYMRFGVPEIYPMLDWATIYKEVLEDFSTMLKAYSRIAMKISGIKKSNQAAAKSLMGTNVTAADRIERHPSPVAGATMLTSQGVDIQAVKTAGATTSPDEFNAFKLQIAAAAGIPATFFGDVDVGNFATAQTLDRPTELKMIGRQEFWKTVFNNIFDYIKYWSANAPQGKLRQAGWRVERYDNPNGTYAYDVIGPDGEYAPKVDIRFPSIVERNVVDRIRALVGAFTMLGNPLADVIPSRRYMAKLLLEAIGEKNADSLIEDWFPGNSEGAPIVDPQQAQLDAKAKAADLLSQQPVQAPAKPNGKVQ